MYKFKPILKTLVWGTESWLLSAVPGSESVVSEGPAKGRSLTEVYGGSFPLLIKFIDAHADLSIQVHPNDAIAMRRHHSRGKSEMWYVTGVEKGAYLYSGLNREISPQEYDELVENNSICSVLNRFEVQPGDVFYLPAGRIHAIGAGCRLAEIQQCSDITYRIYDYGRKGLDGRPRQLHTEWARSAIDYNYYPDCKTVYERKADAPVPLVGSKPFSVDLLELDSPYLADLSSVGSFAVFVVLAGKCLLKGEGRSERSRVGEGFVEERVVCEEGGVGDGCSQMILSEGECVLILSSQEQKLEIIPESKAKLLACYCK